MSQTEQETFNALIKLGSTKEEAQQVVIADRAINKGEKLFELSAEQQKNSKEARKVGRRQNVVVSKRERKADNEKRELIALLEETLKENCESVKIENAERQIDFSFQNRKFRIILSAPRT